MSAQTELDRMACEDFYQAVGKGFQRRVASWLTRKNNNLLSFEEFHKHLPLKSRHDAGLQVVAIDNIVGSMGRCRDFDRAFCPRRKELLDRWSSIDKAYYHERNLPPVELYKLENDYFVVDGHHRVSVARARGQVYIDAHVTEIDLPPHAMTESIAKV